MAFALLWVTVFIMFFQPVSVWPELAPYQPLRNTAIAALLAFVFSGRAAGARPFLSEPTNRYFLMFAFAQVVSAFVMIWSGSAIEMFNLWLRMGIVYYLITQLALTEYRMRAIMAAIVLGVIYLSYYSLSTFVTNYAPGMRVGGFGWFENSNDLAMILAPCVALCILLSDNKRFMLKLFFLVVAGMFSFNVLFTGSRNGLLGLAVAGGLSLYVSKTFPRAVKGVLFVMLFGAMLTVGLKSVLSRADLAGSLSGDDSSEYRIEQWKACIRMAVKNPVFGIGPGEFPYVAEEYEGIHGLMPHNTILQVFAESGFLGGISFVLFAFSHMYSQRKRIFSGTAVSKHITISLLGFWVCAIFGNRYYAYLPYVLLPLLIASSYHNTPRMNDGQ